MKDSFLFLAEGFEEIEAITAIDVLRRGGLNLKTVSITSALQVKGAHGVTVNADLLFDNTLFSEPDWLILPGGMPGAVNLYEFSPLQGLLRKQAESKNGRIAAICASPAVVLGQLGLLKGEKVTCYPGFESYLKGSELMGDPVVTSGKFILGNGPANSLSWALTILEAARDRKAAVEVANGMLYYPDEAGNIEQFFG